GEKRSNASMSEYGSPFISSIQYAGWSVTPVNADIENTQACVASALKRAVLPRIQFVMYPPNEPPRAPMRWPSTSGRASIASATAIRWRYDCAPPCMSQQHL